jgi:hypothetical protein
MFKKPSRIAGLSAAEFRALVPSVQAFQNQIFCELAKRIAQWAKQLVDAFNNRAADGAMQTAGSEYDTS